MKKFVTKISVNDWRGILNNTRIDRTGFGSHEVLLYFVCASVNIIGHIHPLGIRIGSNEVYFAERVNLFIFSLFMEARNSILFLFTMHAKQSLRFTVCVTCVNNNAVLVSFMCLQNSSCAYEIHVFLKL